MNSLWPKEVVLPQGSKDKYFKPQDGKNLIRISHVHAPVFGWIDWHDKKPVRYRYDQKPARAFVESKPVRLFCTFVVYDYATSSVRIYEITQASVQKAIKELSENKAWGDPRGYDIEIIKTGVMKDTEYTVMPIPPKPADAAVVNAFESIQIDLEALFDGQDPFNAASAVRISMAGIPSDEDMFIDMIQLDDLETLITSDADSADVTNKILGRLNLNCLAEMKKPDFPRIATWLKTRQAGRVA